mmetsp:Transcript_105811/g.129099  ORF Transcript_105811/g.129099 Transcript_105811/m.129099 type:complete len:193 (-) Transcript_105811:1083-1661(-)
MSKNIRNLISRLRPKNIMKSYYKHNILYISKIYTNNGNNNKAGYKQPSAPDKPRYSKNIKLCSHNIPKPDKTKKITGDQFITKSRELIETLYNGLIHLEQINKGSNSEVKVRMNDCKSNLTITIDNLGTFMVNCDDKRFEINVFSPVSTTSIYICIIDEYNTDNWLSINDGHSIIQLLSTEINQYCQGFPQF